MCYLEDIYHAKCNHWSAQPRIYHKCAAASQPDNHYSCSAKKTTGSKREDSFCKKCEFDPEKAFKGQGMWLSVTSSGHQPIAKKRFHLNGTAPQRAGTPDLKANERRPAGFLSGRMGL